MDLKYYEGDVLEHALNFGLNSAAKRFNVDRKIVYDIVIKFKNEIGDDVCACVESAKKGIWMMCMICTKDSGTHRINIR